MLLVEERFRDFINDEIADAEATTEAITCLSADSREQIDETVAKASSSVDASARRGPGRRAGAPGVDRQRLWAGGCWGW